MKPNNKSKQKNNQEVGSILTNVTCSNLYLSSIEYGIRYSPDNPYEGDDNIEFYNDLQDLENLKVIYSEEVDFNGEPYGFTRDYRMGFNVECNFGSKSLTAFLNLIIVVGGGDLDVENFPLVDLKLSLVCSLEFDQETTNKEQKEDLSIQALAILWPYAREYVADTLRRGGDFPALLPIIDARAALDQGLITIKDHFIPLRKVGF
jgi:hypothetical protein